MGAVHRFIRVTTPLLCGFIIGSALSLLIFRLTQNDEFFAANCPSDKMNSKRTIPPQQRSIYDVVQHNAITKHFESVIRQPVNPPANVVDLSVDNKKSSQKSNKLVRPRFFATEVGMRDKLLMVVIVEGEDFAMAEAINRTCNHHISKVVYFVNHKHISLHQQDTSVIHLPWNKHDMMLEVLAYLLNRRMIINYDWVFVISDRAYIRGFKLHELVTHMSIGRPVYVGRPINDDSSYCDLNAGVLMSQELIQQLHDRLHDCYLLISQSDPSDVNLGHCITRLLNRTCDQRHSVGSFGHFVKILFDKAFKSWQVSKESDIQHAIHSQLGTDQDDFNSVHTVFGDNMHPSHIHQLNIYFCQHELDYLSDHEKTIVDQIQQLSGEISSYPTSWPPGVQQAQRPRTRFEVYKWDLFNGTHAFKNDAEQNLEKMNQLDSADIAQITDLARQYIDQHPDQFDLGDQSEFLALDTAYRMFDPNRGMNYVLDMLYSQQDGTQVLCRTKVMRPLTRTEIVHEVPYVTEETNITLIVPVDLTSDIAPARNFAMRFARLCMGGYQDKHMTRILLCLIGQAHMFNDPSVSKLTQEIASLAERCSGSAKFEVLFVVNKGQGDWTDFTVIDHVISHIGPNHLMLYTTVWTNFNLDFLNRVRLNTIKNYQVFFPIAFRQFNPSISGKGRDITAILDGINNANINENQLPSGDDFLMPMSNSQDELSKIEVHKDVGRFDPDEFRFAAFYGLDYVRHRSNKIDISEPSSLIQLFIEHSELHVMRAIEPQLVIHHNEQLCPPSLGEENYSLCLRSRRLGLASKAQLAVLVLAQNEKQRLQYSDNNRAYQ